MHFSVCMLCNEDRETIDKFVNFYLNNGADAIFMAVDRTYVNTYIHHIRLLEKVPHNMIDQTQRPAPPKPVARKASPVNAEYEDKAKDMVREAMKAQGVTVEQLTERLKAIGVDMSSGGVANKISRGGFSSAFLLQCFAALNLNLEAKEK